MKASGNPTTTVFCARSAISGTLFNCILCHYTVHILQLATNLTFPELSPCDLFEGCGAVLLPAWRQAEGGGRETSSAKASLLNGIDEAESYKVREDLIEGPCGASVPFGLRVRESEAGPVMRGLADRCPYFAYEVREHSLCRCRKVDVGAMVEHLLGEGYEGGEL